MVRAENPDAAHGFIGSTEADRGDRASLCGESDVHQLHRFAMSAGERIQRFTHFRGVSVGTLSDGGWICEAVRESGRAQPVQFGGVRMHQPPRAVLNLRESETKALEFRHLVRLVGIHPNGCRGSTPNGGCEQCPKHHYRSVALRQCGWGGFRHGYGGGRIELVDP